MVDEDKWKITRSLVRCPVILRCFHVGGRFPQFPTCVTQTDSSPVAVSLWCSVSNSHLVRQLPLSPLLSLSPPSGPVPLSALGRLFPVQFFHLSPPYSLVEKLTFADWCFRRQNVSAALPQVLSQRRNILDMPGRIDPRWSGPGWCSWTRRCHLFLVLLFFFLLNSDFVIEFHH